MVFMVFSTMPPKGTDDSQADRSGKSNPESHKNAHHNAPGNDCPLAQIEELFSSASQQLADGDLAKTDCLLYEADARAERENQSVPPLLRVRIKAKRGHLYETMGHSPKAIDCYEAGIQIAEDHGLGFSERAAVMHNNLASLKKDDQQWEKVEYHYKRALLILEMLNGGFNPKVATVYHNIGCCHARSNNYPMAIRLLKRAYKIRRMCLGKDELHPDTKRTKLHLGATLLADGQWKESKKYFALFSKKEVNEFLERVSGPPKRLLN